MRLGPLQVSYETAPQALLQAERENREVSLIRRMKHLLRDKGEDEDPIRSVRAVYRIHEEGSPARYVSAWVEDHTVALRVLNMGHMTVGLIGRAARGELRAMPREGTLPPEASTAT